MNPTDAVVYSSAGRSILGLGDEDGVGDNRLIVAR
jgi:hypothetical protein